jgi:hypothetical protein
VRQLTAGPSSHRALISINASLPGYGHGPTVDEAYELYLVDGDGGRRLEALVCAGPLEMMRIVRERLKADDLAAIEVHQDGRRLFTLEP